MEMRVDGKAAVGLVKGQEFIVQHAGGDFRAQWLEAGAYRFVELHANGEATVNRLDDDAPEEQIELEPETWPQLPSRIVYQETRCADLIEAISQGLVISTKRTDWSAIMLWAQELADYAKWLSDE